MEQVTIDIDEQGNAKLTVNGCPGSSCKNLTAQIEKALGTVSNDKNTGEFYEQAKARLITKR